MLKSASPRPKYRRRDYLVSADAFLLTGALFLLTVGVLALLFKQPSIWSEILSQVAMVGSVVAGALGAWRMHGHALRNAWLGIAGALVVGAAVCIPAFLAVFTLGHLIPNPFPGNEGPWGSILLLAVIVIAYLAVPLVDAMRDLVRHLGSARIAVARLAALLVILAVVVVSIVVGGESAEIGIFMIPASATSATSLVLAAWFGRWRARRRRAQPRHA